MSKPLDFQKIKNKSIKKGNDGENHTRNFWYMKLGEVKRLKQNYCPKISQQTEKKIHYDRFT